MTDIAQLPIDKPSFRIPQHNEIPNEDDMGLNGLDNILYVNMEGPGLGERFRQRMGEIEQMLALTHQLATIHAGIQVRRRKEEGQLPTDDSDDSRWRRATYRARVMEVYFNDGVYPWIFSPSFNPVQREIDADRSRFHWELLAAMLAGIVLPRPLAASSEAILGAISQSIQKTNFTSERRAFWSLLQVYTYDEVRDDLRVFPSSQFHRFPIYIITENIDTMALISPLEIQEPPGHPRQPIRNHLLLAVGLAMSVLYFWGPFAVMALEGTLPPRELVSLVTAVISLVFFLQVFLLYRLVSETRACPAVTDPVDAFFHETRAGSVVLLCLCVPWCVMAAFGLVLSVPAAAESLFRHRDRENIGRLLGLVFSFIMATTPLALATGLWWASRTAGRALCRALMADAGRGQYQGVPLGLDEQRSDEQRFQTGRRADGDSTGKVTTIFGVLPAPSWSSW
ncbi:hypothetical protein ISF_06859 [Cordyceps fumosorosea ARSEF 2679]|uniref:Uncharacterized protein n=1 Tax=Cordyceps fumosorosea (strain ARSEF 2679) TaxID=1081104 RepID=A0A167R6N1_CORFA|nr:hypothetical protein ISF_06859 [Cordyceps fumosorosea ARSEF 2679]OAA58320.1 hypothetical protein ISF_06859 [Cordyceps fumosorosea ARSEF 2679]